MTNVTKVLWVSLLCLLSAHFSKAQSLKYLNAGRAGKTLDIKSFSDQLNQIYTDSAVGWAFTIWKNGKLLYNHSGGFKITPSDRLDNIGLPFLSTTRIHIASFSKTITAVAVAKLVDQKKLHWNARVRVFLPSYWRFHPEFEDLTILDLLSMKSGIDGPLDALSSNTDSLRRIMERGPNPDKQGKFNYSNTSYGLLRIVIGYAAGYQELQPAADSSVVGIVTARLYNDFINKHLFEPAGISPQDPYIKSVMLYQLSYEILLLACLKGISVIEDAKVTEGEKYAKFVFKKSLYNHIHGTLFSAFTCRSAK